ncbi:MAG TPA: hypothetical protein VM865_02020, partial [Acidobacteriaceae bacterium]|nr:hypothetical protein [Acidobacteriaceae bacterium]
GRLAGDEASPPMERVRRSRTELHRAGPGGSQSVPIKRAGGCGIGGCGLEDRRPAPAAGSRADTPTLQDGGFDGDEERIERGREQFGEQLARSRSAGGACRPHQG